MGRMLVFLYGVVAYLIFFATFLYAIGFVGGVVVPKGIDDGTVGPLVPSILVNVALLSVFAVQHTVMARPAFKQWWTRIIPGAAERSTFVVATCLALGLIFWQWQPLPGIIWDVQEPWLRGVILGVSALGWAIVLYSSLLIDHFDLFGLRQVTLHLRGIEYTHHPFMERSLYRLVQHPLMTGFFIAFWATPTMTLGHLLFAAVVTTYVVLEVRLEEADLGRHLGSTYAAYRRRTPRFIPLPKRNAAEADLAAGSA